MFHRYLFLPFKRTVYKEYLLMGKIVLLFLALIFIGCEQTFDDIIDAVQNNYQVSLVSPTDSITFRTDDSLVTIRIIFTSSSEVNDVFCDIIASDQSKLNSAPFQLFDDNDDNRFSNDFPFSQFYPNGIYNIKYYVKNADETMQQVALGSFKYNNGQENFAPVISNLVAPDTVTIGSDTTFIQITLDVEDGNGLNDVEFVWFDAYLPNGNPSSQNPIAMFDDGSNGDLVPGDGTYSVIVILPPVGVAQGTFRWEFQAKDRGDKSSNIIIHLLEVI